MRKPGFSMIEMLVVLAIIIMIMGISVAGIGNFGRFKASTDLGAFNSFMRAGFMSSVRTGDYYRIAVDMLKGEYWLESSDTPFFISKGDRYEERKKEADETIERIERAEKSDIFNRETGQAIGVDNFFQRAQLLSEGGIDADEYYHYENFIPDRRSIREILKPGFAKASETKKFSDNLIPTSFFAYHTPEIITNDYILDKKGEKTVYIYIFPQGRIEPFYLGLGEIGDDGAVTFAHITSDMFLNIKINAGDFGDEVKIIQDVLDDQDAQGR